MGIKNIRAGRAAEYAVVGLLTQAGLDVYLTVADDQGIDAIIRAPEGRKHFDVQIKSAKAWGGQRGLHEDRVNRRNLLIIFYNSVRRDLIWLRGDELAKSGVLVKGSWGAIKLSAERANANLEIRSPMTLAEHINNGRPIQRLRR